MFMLSLNQVALSYNECFINLPEYKIFHIMSCLLSSSNIKEILLKQMIYYIDLTLIFKEIIPNSRTTYMILLLYIDGVCLFEFSEQYS